MSSASSESVGHRRSTIMTDEELVLKLESLYYVVHPRYRTNQELIDLISTIADYE